MLNSIPDAGLTFVDAPLIAWITVKDAYNLLWEDNPKLHDVGSVVESILKYGFQELPKYDATLGAIKAGNGRIETLFKMEVDPKVRKQLKAIGLPCPRGLAVSQAGEWVMPLLVGTDAPSLALAKAYAIDSNNLTMTGGDFTAVDMLRMWDASKYLEVLTGLGGEGEYSVTVDAETLDFLVDYDAKENRGKDDSSRGALLDKLKHFGVKDPRPVEQGDVYRFDKHVLVVCDMIRDWRFFVEYLTEGVHFVPFAGAYILVTQMAQDKPLLLVQPEKHVAGLILESAEIIYGSPVVKL